MPIAAIGKLAGTRCALPGRADDSLRGELISYLAYRVTFSRFAFVQNPSCLMGVLYLFLGHVQNNSATARKINRLYSCGFPAFRAAKALDV
jgi:hypothetical protein